MTKRQNIGHQKIIVIGGVIVVLILVSGAFLTQEGRPGALSVFMGNRNPGVCMENSPNILSAFYGLDNSDQLNGEDGLPVVMSGEIQEGTLNPTDFSIVLEDGQRRTPRIASLKPADEEDEDRTILLVGDFGSAVANPPQRVEVVNTLLTEGGSNVKGQAQFVIPLSSGPTLVFAEMMQPNSDCPGTMVRVTWSGGVTPMTNASLKSFKLTAERGQEMFSTSAFDLDDQDNNLELCFSGLAVKGSVSVPEGMFTDPNNDSNPATKVDICTR